MGILKAGLERPLGSLEIDGTMPLVEARDLGVRYVVGNRREDIQSLTYNTLFRRNKKRDVFWALRNAHFVGYPGDILGVVGRNGAGKTTLCRVVSGLLRPDAGQIHIRGRVSALLSLGAGFNPQLSGAENVFLNGTMLGLSRRQIQDLFPQIVEFSGLRHFIHQPLKHYSSGMKARLGFSVAAMMDPEILVVDEALSAGDLEFNKKAARKMQELVRRAKMVIVVTHQVAFVQEYCTRALWIDKGAVRASGDPQQVVSLYKAAQPAAKPRSIDLRETRPQLRHNTVVAVEGLSIRFALRKTRETRSLWALREVSFSVREGEIVGIIGPNGAGKTTLTRVLSGILKPDRGRVFIDGEITALLTHGAGMNEQLPGRDNIYLNGMMLGISKGYLNQVYGDIVEFAELEEFIERPVKHYSSGMKARLGFSISATIKPDVFIIDEALSVGDVSFYEKASARIQEMIINAKAVIVVTHDLGFVEKVCTRAMWLDKGKIIFDGDPKEAVARYRQSVKQ